MKSTEEQLSELERDLVKLDISYQIWRSFTDPNNRDEYLPVMEKYSLFFGSIIDAQYMSVVVALNRVLEAKQNTINLFGIRSQIESEKKINEKDLLRLDLLESQLKEKFSKLVILRSNVFAHRNKKIEISQFYSRAGLSPNLLISAIRQTQDYFNILNFIYLNRTYHFDFIDFIETDTLMKKLAI